MSRLLTLFTTQSGLVRSGLDAFWQPANQYSGAQIQLFDDASGNSNTLTNGTTSGVDAADGAAGATGITFNGTSQYATSQLAAPTQGSLVVAFKPSSVAVRQMLLGALDTVPSRCHIAVTGSAKLGAGIGSQSEATITGTTTLVVGSWYAGCVTWDGTTVSLYLGTNLEYQGAQVGTMPVSTYKLWLGATDNAGGPLAFTNGTIATAAIYHRALSSTEVAQNVRSLRRSLAAKGITL